MAAKRQRLCDDGYDRGFLAQKTMNGENMKEHGAKNVTGNEKLKLFVST